MLLRAKECVRNQAASAAIRRTQAEPMPSFSLLHLRVIKYTWKNGRSGRSHVDAGLDIGRLDWAVLKVRGDLISISKR